MDICIFTDLHSAINPHKLRFATLGCDLVIFVGDIVNFDVIDGCPDSDECQGNVEYMLDFVSFINKPFLFTLGNHDSIKGPEKAFAAKYLGTHPLHIGECNDNFTACLTPRPRIGMLYSGDYGCPSGSFYGCPTPEDATFIQERTPYLDMLFTHIPPPGAQHARYIGIRADYCGGNYSCNWAPLPGVLPNVPTELHLFGHDHNNLYVAGGYVSLLKSGIGSSYGPCFSYNQAGYTTFRYTNTMEFTGFHLFNGEDLNIFDIPHGNCSHVEKQGLQMVPGIYINLLMLFITGIAAACVSLGLIRAFRLVFASSKKKEPSLTKSLMKEANLA